MIPKSLPQIAPPPELILGSSRIDKVMITCASASDPRIHVFTRVAMGAAFEETEVIRFPAING
jgi:hypothetical protein